MAIAFPHVVWLVSARKQCAFPVAPSILEIGEQNWFGDVAIAEIRAFIDQFAPPERRAALHETWQQLNAQTPNSPWLFDVAKLFYQAIFDYSDYLAIDLHGSEKARVHDMNEPLVLEKQYDIVTNIGTAEHIFNVAEVFRSIHNATKSGGFMLHALPNQGAYDHGFFNFHPTFFFDLCVANHYEMRSMLYVASADKPPRLVPIHSREDYVRLALSNKLSTHSGFMVVLQKPLEEKPFAYPRQGFYDNKLSPELRAAWSALPR